MRLCNTLVIASILLLNIQSIAHANTQKDDQGTAYRKHILNLTAYNFGALGEMVRGKKPFDAKVFLQHAERVSQLAKMLTFDEAFPKKPATTVETEALPSLWENTDDFKLKLSAFQQESTALYAVAKTTDETAMKAQFAKTAGTCKACHNDYKTD